MWMRRVFYVTSRRNRYDQTLLQNRIVQNALCQIVGEIKALEYSPFNTSLKAKSDLVIQTRFTTRVVHSTVDDSIANEEYTATPVDTTLCSNKRFDFGEILLLTLYSYPIRLESD